MDDCYYCGVSGMLLQFYCEVMEINTPWMTIDRKDNLKGYLVGNVVPSCFLCNKIKGSFFDVEEMKKIGKQFVAPKLKKFEDEAIEAFGEWCDYNIDLDDGEGWEEPPESTLADT